MANDASWCSASSGLPAVAEILGVSLRPLVSHLLTNPALTCHVPVSSFKSLVVQNAELRLKWNCGLTSPVAGFSANATFLLCCGDLPR